MAITALEWFFAGPNVFLITMTFITMIGTLLATRQIRTSVMVALLTLVYSSYSQADYVTGLVYFLITAMALLTANELYGRLIGGNSAEEI